MAINDLKRQGRDASEEPPAQAPVQKKNKVGWYIAPTEENSLPDRVKEGLDVVVLGLSKATCSPSKKLLYFDNGKNQFYYCIHKAGFTPDLLTKDSDERLPAEFGIGLMTLIQEPFHNTPSRSVDIKMSVGSFLDRLSLVKPKVLVVLGRGTWKDFKSVLVERVLKMEVKEEVVPEVKKEEGSPEVEGVEVQEEEEVKPKLEQEEEEDEDELKPVVQLKLEEEEEKKPEMEDLKPKLEAKEEIQDPEVEEEEDEEMLGCPKAPPFLVPQAWKIVHPDGKETYIFGVIDMCGVAGLKATEYPIEWQALKSFLDDLKAPTPSSNASTFPHLSHFLATRSAKSNKITPFANRTIPARLKIVDVEKTKEKVQKLRREVLG